MMAAPSEERSTLDIALEYAAMGFLVFPVIEDGKLPAINGYLHRATRDPALIRRMWVVKDPVVGVERVRNWNIGIRTGDQGNGRCLLVVDEDVKDGRKGRESLAELDMLEGTPGWLETRVHQTASGGRHFFYWTPIPVRSTASTALGSGLDTRGEVGYVVAPGSTIDGVPYRVLEDRQPSVAPPWLVQRIGRAIEGTAGNVVEILDTATTLQRAEAFLRDRAPAIEGQGGDEWAFKTACAVGDLGISEFKCLELMDDLWNVRCQPAWEYDELSAKVANAYRYRKTALGQRSAEADFDPIEDEPGGAPVRKKLFYEVGDEIEPDLDHVALIDEVIDQGAMSVMYGQSNVGKTFVALSMAYAVATGGQWAGQQAQQGLVVYVAAEAGSSARKRIKGLRLHWGWSGGGLLLVPCPVDLRRREADTGPLIKLIHEIEARFGQKVVLVVVDTLSRALAGGNENGPEDMGALVSNVDRIRVSVGGHTMLIHHSGKEEARGARGHSLLRAATDTEIEVADGTVRFRKQRDMEIGKPVSFRLEGVELGHRPDGKPVTTAVAIMGERASAARDFADLELTRMEELALDCLSEAIASEGVEIEGRWCATTALWLGCFENRYAEKNIEQDQDLTQRKTILRQNGKIGGVLRVHRNALRKKGAVVEVKQNQWAIGEA